MSNASRQTFENLYGTILPDGSKDQTVSIERISEIAHDLSNASAELWTRVTHYKDAEEEELYEDLRRAA